MSFLRFGSLAIVLLGISLASAGIADAARGPAKPAPASTDVKKCKKGEIWNKAKKKCVSTAFNDVPDEELYWQGRELALSGEYAWAVSVLSAIREQKNADVQKFIGYSYRKLGQTETGIGHYQLALAIDPNDVTTREYLGEGYVNSGRIDLAKGQLKEIALRCGKDCDEYKDLAQVIADSTWQ